MMNISELATKLEVSTKTVSNYRKAIDEKYGIETTVKVGRDIRFYDRYIQLFEDMARGLQLPDELPSAPPSSALVVPELDAEIVTVQPKPRARFELAPVARNNIQAVDQQLDQDNVDLRNMRQLRRQRLIQQAIEDAIEDSALAQDAYNQVIVGRLGKSIEDSGLVG